MMRRGKVGRGHTCISRWRARREKAQPGGWEDRPCAQIRRISLTLMRVLGWAGDSGAGGIGASASGLTRDSEI